MSRVGKKEINIPEGVKVAIEKSVVAVNGPLGRVGVALPEKIHAEVSDGLLKTVRQSEAKTVRALHGLIRSLLANAVHGVSQGFTRELDVVGIGYRVEAKDKRLNLSLGYSHPVSFPVPEGVEIKVDRAQRTIANYVATVVVKGCDKQQVGQVAADIRSIRPPDRYKGKGIRYADEVVKLKVGKKGA